MMVYKSREVQKTIWKSHKATRVMFEVQRDTANHMGLLERDADVRQPFRQGWKWSRIFPGGNFRPKQIRFTGEEKALERLPINPSSRRFLQTLHYRRND